MVKLLRYELKSLLRGLLPIYGAVLAVALCNRVLWLFPLSLHADGPLSGIAAIIALSVYILLCIGVAVLTLIVIVQRFYQGLLGKEGYLMFTLPLKSWQLIGSKLLGAFLVTMLSTIVGICSILILLSYPEIYQDFLAIHWAEIIHDAFVKMPSWPLFLVEFFFYCCILTFASTLLLYFSMALGHLSHNHRILWAVIWYVILSTVISALESIVTALVPSLSFLSVLEHATTTFQLHLVFWYGIGYYLLQSVVFFIGTNFILNRRLNLQ